MLETNMLVVKKLSKEYRDFALRDIDICLPKGKIMGFIGPNGAGKSTTIKSILNIVPFSSGEILIDGKDNIRDDIQAKQAIGYVGEHLNLYESVSGQQFYKFYSSYYDQWDEVRFQQLVKTFGIDLRKKIGSLSKGTAVKYTISLALSHHPKLLILDEPTSGLDPVVRNDVLDILLDIVKAEQTAVFFSSHITEDIEKIADYVTYIDKGRILSSDTKERLLKRYKKVTFADELPEHIVSQLMLYRNRSAIVGIGDSIEVVESLDIDKNLMKWLPASLDDILLLLIKENENNVEINH